MESFEKARLKNECDYPGRVGQGWRYGREKKGDIWKAKSHAFDERPHWVQKYLVLLQRNFFTVICGDYAFFYAKSNAYLFIDLVILWIEPVALCRLVVPSTTNLQPYFKSTLYCTPQLSSWEAVSDQLRN